MLSVAADIMEVPTLWYPTDAFVNGEGSMAKTLTEPSRRIP